MGCIGMGQAPATDRISLRTVPRNFPGRSGTPEDQVYLCSPETAAASALTGVITDPRDLGIAVPAVPSRPARSFVNTAMLVAPPRRRPARRCSSRARTSRRSPTSSRCPRRSPVPVLLKLGDNVSTDEILPAGARVLPLPQQHPGDQPVRVRAASTTRTTTARSSTARRGGHVDRRR